MNTRRFAALAVILGLLASPFAVLGQATEPAPAPEKQEQKPADQEKKDEAKPEKKPEGDKEKKEDAKPNE